ncbi:MAG: ribonuclease PH [Oligoflexales bacterium]|jgi:ribonuclease PH|nr:ribonuclease PH [Oligoflexales bacterium]
MRNDGRGSEQMRPLTFTPNFTKYTDGNVLVEFGDTKVICTVTVEEGIPHFLKGSNPPQGWLTAEYAMLPSATDKRTKRERNNVSGRTQEIQRLIGRALRGVIDLKLCPDLTFTIDCDVIQADGGTRTASITGAYIALKMAVDKLLRRGRIRNNPLTNAVAAVSIGLIDSEVLVDLNYIEDSSADLDMNIVMTQSGEIVEIQGTGEKANFSKQQVLDIMTAAEFALKPIFDLQHAAAEGRQVEA